MHRILIVLLALTSVAHGQSHETTVAPLPSENFAGPCHYDISFPAGNRTAQAVWVTFDRGQDIMEFYEDPDVLAFARRHKVALMMPHQCPGKNAPGGPKEMDVEPSHGVGTVSGNVDSTFPDTVPPPLKVLHCSALEEVTRTEQDVV